MCAENLGQQGFDLAVILCQQRQPLGVIGGGAGGQLGVQRVQLCAQRKKAVVQVGVRRVKAQNAPPVDTKFLHTGINGKVLHRPSPPLKNYAAVKVLVFTSKLPLVLTPV